MLLPYRGGLWSWDPPTAGAVRGWVSQAGRASPDSNANTTSCARSRAHSFTIARLTRVLAVAGLTMRCWEISSFGESLGHQAHDLALSVRE
jgi:hypothetical protein